MPEVRVVFYQDDDGTVPALDWISSLVPRAQIKCLARIRRLQQHGHDLRRPEADYLRDGVYELRVGLQGVNYRILYHFHGREAAILSHGLVKQRRVPPNEIDLAIEGMLRFEQNPVRHTYEMEV